MSVQQVYLGILRPMGGETLLEGFEATNGEVPTGMLTWTTNEEEPAPTAESDLHVTQGLHSLFVERTTALQGFTIFANANLTGYSAVLMDTYAQEWGVAADNTIEMVVYSNDFSEFASASTATGALGADTLEVNLTGITAPRDNGTIIISTTGGFTLGDTHAFYLDNLRAE